MEEHHRRYTFDTFVVGASNQFAHAASLAVANQPATAYNPLFIYGGVGLGKTHLMYAIGNQAQKVWPSLKIVYLSSETFMNELINAIRYDKIPEFQFKYRTIDILLLDDVQFLAGKERTQEEFFHTFNYLYDSQKQIVVTSDKAPQEIPELEERLRSRFEWGLIADIQRPDMETRVAILNKKAEQEGIDLPQDVSLFLASRITSNVRMLEGCLTRLKAFSGLTGEKISVDMCQRILKDILETRPPSITPEDIVKAVAKYFDIRPAELKSPKRLKKLSQARQIAMYLCRDLTSASFPEIGEKFGGKDHSTVIYAVKKMEDLLRVNPELKNDIKKIQRLLLS
jgi:chromosomal replication initiator protein